MSTTKKSTKPAVKIKDLKSSKSPKGGAKRISQN